MNRDALIRPLGRPQMAATGVLLTGALAMTLGATATPASRAATPARAAGRAILARVLSLHEQGDLHITVNRGSSLEANGQVSGTLDGTLVIRVAVRSAEEFSIALVGKSHSGTVSGSGTARFSVSGHNLPYAGSMNITSGTGSYSHAHGSGIHISGVMNRQHQSITATINGKLYL